MARYACLFVTDLPLAAAIRVEPELRGRPVAIVEGGDERATILAGWMRGLTVAQARVIRTDLVVRPFSAEGLRSAQRALLDVGRSVTPQVEESRRPGLVFLDLEGTRALFPSEPGLRTALEARLAEAGLQDARIGMGSTRTVAELAARHRGGGHLVSPGEILDFLDPLPVDLLEPPEEVEERLTRFGIRTLGELRRLDLKALGARLGEEGVSLARRARGEDLQPFRPTPLEVRLEEGLETGYPVESLETLGFFARGVLDRLAHRLRLRGLATRELLVELELSSGRAFARAVRLAAPTVEAPVLLSLVRLALERDPPQEPVERLRIIATPSGVESAQLDFFLPPLPAPAELAVTVARLEALCGAGRVGAPHLESSHLPDAVTVDAFRPEGRSPRGEGAQSPVASLALALRILRPPLAVRTWGADGAPKGIEPLADAQRRGLASHALGVARSEPQASEVAGTSHALGVARSEPQASEGGWPRPPSAGTHFVGGRVLRCAGPWRLFGEWWGESRFARDYFDVELEDGGIYRLYRNLEDGAWFVDGVYD